MNISYINNVYDHTLLQNMGFVKNKKQENNKYCLLCTFSCLTPRLNCLVPKNGPENGKNILIDQHFHRRATLVDFSVILFSTENGSSGKILRFLL